MSFTSLSVFASVFSSTSVSETQLYGGILRQKNQTYYLQVSDSLSKTTIEYSLAFNDPISEKITTRLTTGDFVSIQASEVSSPQKNKTLNVISINYIGLNLLLGTWHDDDGVCYEFQNFTTLLIYNLNSTKDSSINSAKGSARGACDTGLNSNSSTVRKMNYFVNPDDNDWFLLISDKSAQYVAELINKNDKTIQLNLFDEQTGAILSKVILRR